MASDLKDDSMPPTLREDVTGYLSALRDTAKYNLARIDEEIASLASADPADPIAYLTCRGLVHGYVGMHGPAIRDLTAAASLPEGKTPRILSKLAQMHLQRGQEEDLGVAESLSKRALEVSGFPAQDYWLSHQNLGIVNHLLGRKDTALEHAKAALNIQEDPRTVQLLKKIEANAGTEIPWTGAAAVAMSRSEPMR